MERAPDTYHFTQELKKALKNIIGYFFISIYLAPLAAGAVIARGLSFLYGLAIALIEPQEAVRPAEPEQKCRDDELIIPSTVLHEAFRILREHGKRGREWIVALGYQKIDGRNIVTHIYNLKCPISLPASAEPDHVDLARALGFYEKCGAEIAGLVHIHPWNARTVSPSATDIETHSLWEELYEGRFIGIVFTNSGVFRIFHGKKCRFRPVIVGEGVRKIGNDLYVLEA